MLKFKIELNIFFECPFLDYPSLRTQARVFTNPSLLTRSKTVGGIATRISGLIEGT